MAQSRGGAQEDGAENWGIIILVLTAVVFYLISTFFWTYVVVWKHIRIVEVGALAYIVPNFIQNWMDSSFNDGLHFLLTTNPKDMTAEMVSAFDNIYVRYFNWLPAILISWAGIKLFLSAEDVSQVYNMESLLSKMLNAFPHNKDFIGKHPEKTPLDFYPDDPESYEYSMCMTERQFAQVVPPLGLMEAAKKNKNLLRPIWDGKKGFDDELARKSFETQLGPLYRGYNYLSQDEKTLMDLFRNKILVKQAAVLPIMKEYVKQAYEYRKSNNMKNGGISGPKEGLDLPEFRYLRDFASHKQLAHKLSEYVDNGLAKKNQDSSVLGWTPKDSDLRKMIVTPEYKNILRHVMADECLSNHAYTYTGLMSLLEAAREGATLAPSSLRWLKGRNRTLWFALNCCGKKVAFTESAGTFAHWLLEKEAKMAIPHPEVTEAIEALRVALGLPTRAGGQSKDEWG